MSLDREVALEYARHAYDAAVHTANRKGSRFDDVMVFKMLEEIFTHIADSAPDLYRPKEKA